MEDATQVIASSGEATAALPAAGATVAIERPICSVCTAEGVIGDPYCPECGFLLGSVMGTPEEVADLSQLPRLRDVKTGAEHFLREGENTVGRERGEVLLQDSTVSRTHARIRFADGEFTLADLGSTNGTHVNGGRLQANTEQRIAPGDEITFGAVTLVLDVPGAELPAVKTSVAELDVSARKQSDETAPPEGVYAVLEPLSSQAPRLYLASDTATLGRRQGDIIVPDDPYVSGRHCRFQRTDIGVSVTDLGSSNGTLLNGERLKCDDPIFLTDGDTLTIGQRSWRFALMQKPEPNSPGDEETGSADSETPNSGTADEIGDLTE